MNNILSKRETKETKDHPPTMMLDASQAILSIKISKSHSSLYYPHDEAWVGDLIVVGGVAVHQLHVECKLSQGDVGVNVVVFGSHPLHLDLMGKKEKDYKHA